MINRKDKDGGNAGGGDRHAPSPRQHDPIGCPTWCSGEHLHEALSDGFHHDGLGQTLWLAKDTDGGEQRVSVVPTALDRGQDEPLGSVELHIDETICSLSPEQALQVASWLRDIARAVGAPPATRSHSA